MLIAVASAIKKRWELGLLLILFIIFKIPHLSYPYYWDESWPYATAIAEMCRNGISLLPTAIDGEISRGHPLFFHAAAALWMKIFGSSHISMHSFALSISCVFLVVIYEAGLRLFNRKVAFMALLLVATQVVFFVQSSYVLFEMLIALLVFLSIWLYTTGRYWLTALCLSALFYTKESGLIAGFVLGLDAIVRLFDNKTTLKKRIMPAVSIAIPCVLIAIFFILQKQARGWYVLPYYTGLIEHKWDAFWRVFSKITISSQFIDDYRYNYLYLLIILCVFIGIKNKWYSLLPIIIPAAIIYYIAADKVELTYPYALFYFITLIVSYIGCIYLFSRPVYFKELRQRKFIFLSGFFIICFVIFSSLNFFTYRYLLASIVPLLFLAAVFIEKLLQGMHKSLYFVALAVVAYISFYAYVHDKGYGDTDRAGFSGMKVQQAVVDFFENNNYYNKSLGIGGFLCREHLMDPTTGFLKSKKVFTDVKWEITGATDFTEFDNIECDYRYREIKSSPDFHLVFRYTKGDLWAEIYQKN